MIKRFPIRRAATAACALLALAACEDGFDVDLRGQAGAFSTAPAAQSATAARPQPDNRGVISYPNYQVAVARRGDTLNDVAARVGVDATALAKFNGIEPQATLRKDEIIALPRRVAEPSPATGAVGTGPIQPPQVDVTTLAGQAIDNAPATRPTPAPAAARAAAQTGQEPIRHKVTRGETAFSVARLYKVPVRSLADWNGLGAQFDIREGQVLLIPVTEAAPVAPPETAPGQGSPTPTPPSADKPLPQDTDANTASTQPKPQTDLGAQTQASASTGGQFAFPVQGTIIRDYAKGRNEGINIKGAPGAAVKSAEAGTVAAITESSEGVPIIVVRHEDNLLTVYANVTDVSVSKGDKVRRGQGLAKLRSGDQSFVHFEVRQGFDSVDPNDFLN